MGFEHAWVVSVSALKICMLLTWAQGVTNRCANSTAMVLGASVASLRMVVWRSCDHEVFQIACEIFFASVNSRRLRCKSIHLLSD
jgi:hypothetical protein